MQPLLSYNKPTVGGHAPPSAPISFGSMAQYGQSPYAIGSVPAPAPAVPVPVADVTVPQVAVAPTPGPLGSVNALPGFGQDALTDGLRGLGVNAQNPMEGFSWKGLMKDTFMNENGSLNFGNIGAVVNSIGALGSLWSGFQQNRLASDALDFQKDAYRTNLDSQRGSYNLALEDRIRSRYAAEGRSQADADAYISKHKLGK